MNQIEAFRETLAYCEERWPAPMFGETSIEHMRDMLRRIEANRDATAPDGFSEAKLGRWLGYLQGVAVGLDVMALDDCKAINMKWADEPRGEAAPKYEYHWRVSFNRGEAYGNPHPSKESAAAEARASDGGLIAECLQQDFDLHLMDGDSILDMLADNNEERVSDDGDFIEATLEQRRDLAAMVDAAIAAWAEKHAINTTAYMFADVRNEEQIEGEAA